MIYLQQDVHPTALGKHIVMRNGVRVRHHWQCNSTKASSGLAHIFRSPNKHGKLEPLLWLRPDSGSGHHAAKAIEAVSVRSGGTILPAYKDFWTI